MDQQTGILGGSTAPLRRQTAALPSDQTQRHRVRVRPSFVRLVRGRLLPPIGNRRTTRSER